MQDVFVHAVSIYECTVQCTSIHMSISITCKNSLTPFPFLGLFPSSAVAGMVLNILLLLCSVTTIHAGVGARGQPLQAFWDGRCIKLRVGIYEKKKIVNNTKYLALDIIITFYTYFTSFGIFIFYFTLILAVFFTLQHFNKFSHARLFIYVRLLLCNLLFLEYILFYLGLFTITIFTKHIFYYYFFLFFLHGHYTLRGPDH